jgi:predicted esterase
MASSGADGQPSDTRKLLLLHGSRQTGQLLLSRIDKLRKKLLGVGVQLVAPDAPFPHPEDKSLRQWWTSRTGDHCDGLDESLQMLKELWQSERFEGVMGFSQGARMAHLMAVFANVENAFPCLQYVILVSGYDAPLPFSWKVDSLLDIPSLHVWGSSDKLIAPQQSQSVMQYYRNPQHHEHQGGHHVPMRAANVEAYLNFIKESAPCTGSLQTTQAQFTMPSAPNDEAAIAQLDEVEALSAIFPDEFTLLSKKIDNNSYQHPIRYRLALPESDTGTWPPHPISLVVEYPVDYPGHSLATISFDHENNMMELSSGHIQLCLKAMKEAAEAEEGMPSVLSCVYAAREFFESGGMETAAADVVTEKGAAPEKETSAEMTTVIQSVSRERIEECNLQGLEIARTLLSDNAIDTGKGGSWKYTIGLVGKPSAGKSTFFNAATGFARQRDDAGNALGGATMAPHPFTTIDPNVGFCLVSAPKGSCPEEEYDGDLGSIGCTHGRDSNGRRLFPVMLKDVAGLVPGAYQGRGRGNKFLNDLTDADVLIHVVDASGTADTEGNDVGVDGKSAGGSHPLSDLSWIRNELVEWVYANVMHKWDNIRRRGRSKVSKCF